MDIKQPVRRPARRPIAIPAAPAAATPPPASKRWLLADFFGSRQISGLHGSMILAYVAGLFSMLIWVSALDIQATVNAAGSLAALKLPSQSAARVESKLVKTELLVRFKSGLTKEQQAKLVADEGVKELDEIRPLRVKRLLVPAAAADKISQALANRAEVELVEPNYLAEALVAPNDPQYASEWQNPMIGAPVAWDKTTGATSVPIAVLDSGVDADHPDLAAKLLPGYNFYDNNTATDDIHGHGTAVAGVAAAIGNNGVGIAGLSWGSPIMPLRISDASAWATYYAMAKAITYAVDHGVRVINLSYGGTSYSATLQSAIDYAWSKNALVFASAGNYNNSTPLYPAASNHVIAVAATDSGDNKASFSNYGSWIDVAAPGNSVYSTTWGGGYGWKSGTSFASPITAGLAALIISANPGLTNVQVEQILKESAKDLGAAGFDQYFGYGRIDAAKAVALASSTPVDTQPTADLTAPTIGLTKPAANSMLEGQVSLEASASDNIGVSKVIFYYNGVAIATDTAAPYAATWDTTKLANGSYSLEARAYDAAGNVGYSAVVPVVVSNAIDATAPIVTITQPAAGATVSGRSFAFEAKASDDKAVAQLSLILDGKTVKTCAAATVCQQKVNTGKLAVGSHALVVEALDVANNKGFASSTFIYKK